MKTPSIFITRYLLLDLSSTEFPRDFCGYWEVGRPSNYSGQMGIKISFFNKFTTFSFWTFSDRSLQNIMRIIVLIVYQKLIKIYKFL